MNIHNVVLHEVNRGDNNTVIINLRESENSINDKTLSLSESLSKLFNRTGLQWGAFEKSDKGRPVSRFETILDESFSTVEGFDNFLDYSRRATKIFASELSKTGSGKGGYLWYNFYTEEGEDYLTVVLLRKKEALQIQDDLTLDSIERVDLETLHMAAKIDLPGLIRSTS